MLLSNRLIPLALSCKHVWLCMQAGALNWMNNSNSASPVHVSLHLAFLQPSSFFLLYLPFPSVGICAPECLAGSVCKGCVTTAELCLCLLPSKDPQRVWTVPRIGRWAVTQASSTERVRAASTSANRNSPIDFSLGASSGPSSVSYWHKYQCW